MIVVDASIIAPLLIDDETPIPAWVLERLMTIPLLAPSHWPLETANMLHVAERRQRIDRAARNRALRLVRRLEVSLVAEALDRAWEAVSQLADRYRLTIYEAAYLDLAIRRDAALATLDGALVSAARDSAIEVITYP